MSRRQSPCYAGGKVSEAMQAFRTFLGDSNMMAYLAMMAPRLVELRRALKPTGSIYLHCDPTASHYLKMLMDAIFGPINFKDEIVWKRTSGHSDARRNFGDQTDSLLFYGRGPDAIFNVQYVPYSESYLKSHYSNVDESGRRFTTRDLRSPHPRPNLTYVYKGYQPHPNGWSVSLERMQELDAAGLLYFPSGKAGRIRIKRYLDDAPGSPVGNLWDDIPPINSQAQERLGYPTQKPEALLERIIDGRIYFHEGDTAKTRQIILSVKAGHVTVAHLRDLRGVLDREKAEIGVLICMDAATTPMRKEAASAGFYASPWGQHPRLQILTIEDLLTGKTISRPPQQTNVTFKRAPRARDEVRETRPMPFGEPEDSN
ncbi:MAG: site-specific DNA-methyltransferase [Acidobacteriota bacterium]